MADERYEFIEEIARGGAAVVWRVRDRHLQRETAVKYLLDSNDNRDMRARLEREARLCAGLVHPGIVPIHELSSFKDQRPFVSMKLVEGQTLLQLLESQSLPRAQAHIKALEDIFTKVCEAMAFAHQRGIIHRDLKPSNIMVGSFGEVQIMDWGLAKDLSPASPKEEGHRAISDTVSDDCSRGTVNSLDDTQKIINIREQTIMGSVLGTIAYMSPEQARGELDLVDRRSDVFALGAVLCKILTGHAPYHGADQTDLLGQAQVGDLKRTYQQLSRSAHKRLASLAVTCMAISPDARPTDAGVVVELLNAARLQDLKQQRLIRFAIACGTAGALAAAFFFSNGTKEENASALTLPELPAPGALDEDFDVEKYKLELQGEQRLEALSKYPVMLSKAPENEGLHYVVAATLVNARRFAEAENLGRVLIKLNPSSAEYQYLLGQALYWQAKFEVSQIALLESKRLRNAGSITEAPIDERLEIVQQAIDIARQGDYFNIADYQAWDTYKIFTTAKIYELLGKIDSAIELNNLALGKMPDIERQGFERHQLLVGFTSMNVNREDLSEKSRNQLCRAALQWLDEQYKLGSASAKVTGDNSGPPKPSQSLLSVLKSDSRLKFLREFQHDDRIAADIRAGFTSLFKLIDEHPAK